MSMFDFLIVMVFFLFLVSIFLFAITDASGLVQHLFNTTPIIANSPQALANSQAVANQLQVFNYGIPFVSLGLMVVALVLGAGLASRPITIAFGFISLFVIVIILFYISNIAHQIATQPALEASAIKYPNILAELAEMPVIATIFCLIYLIVVLMRSRGIGIPIAAPQGI